MNGITRHKGGGVENPRGRSVTNLLPEDICKRWVTDLTSQKLRRAVISVLACGLNFSVTPKEVRVAEIVTNVKSCLTLAKLVKQNITNCRMTKEAIWVKTDAIQATYKQDLRLGHMLSPLWDRPLKDN